VFPGLVRQGARGRRHPPDVARDPPLGYVEQAGGNLAAAQAAFAESLQLRREAGWKPGVAAAELALAGVLADRGRVDQARDLARSAADTWPSSDATAFRVSAPTNYRSFSDMPTPTCRFGEWLGVVLMLSQTDRDSDEAA